MELKHTQYFTPYQIWLNSNAELDSRKHGIRISDVDTYIQNYRTGVYMLIEWKCRLAVVQFPQTEIIQTIHAAFKQSGDPRYAGYVTIRLSGETPDDSDKILVSGELIKKSGSVLYDNKPITREQLTNLLKLNWRT